MQIVEFNILDVVKEAKSKPIELEYLIAKRQDVKNIKAESSSPLAFDDVDGDLDPKKINKVVLISKNYANTNRDLIMIYGMAYVYGEEQMTERLYIGHWNDGKELMVDYEG